MLWKQVYPMKASISAKAVEMLKNLPKTKEGIFSSANNMRSCF
jgi:hypothetical protein